MTGSVNLGPTTNEHTVAGRPRAGQNWGGFTDQSHMTLRIRSTEEAIAEIRAADPLKDFFTWWDRVTPTDLEELTSALDGARSEEDVQQFLQAHPHILIQHLGGGHGRWVIPKARLGSEHVTDFMIAEKHSFGFEWQAVELESPHRPMFNRNGDLVCTMTLECYFGGNTSG